MVDRLFEEWRAYQKLLEHDYMDHRAFFGRLAETLRARFDRPLALLDLGCGDAQPVRALLEAVEVRRYVGVDEAAGALARAERNLSGLDIDAAWVEGDLLEEVGRIDGDFDVILASFSLHHLPGPAPKGAVLQACRRRLAPDGLLAVIDVFRAPGEERAAYLERWIDFAERHYHALTRREKGLLFEHVRARDFPECVPTYRQLACVAGFGDLEVLCTDAAELNRLVVAAPAP